MTNYLTYLTALPQLLSLVREVLELTRHAEDLLTGGARGAEKKALVLTILDTTVALAQRLGIPEAYKVDRDQLKAVTGSVIDTLVSTLNTLGVYHHAAA
jgi:hypothetical protein